MPVEISGKVWKLFAILEAVINKNFKESRVGGDHRQAQPVKVIGLETVVVQDDIFVVGISPRRRRILHAAARVLYKFRFVSLL